jgi:hypothetical protein
VRHHRVLWDGLAVGLVAFGLSVGGWALTHSSSADASSCQDFSQLHAGDGHPHPGMDSLARVQSVTLSRVSGGGLQVSWQLNQRDPSLGQVTVGELHVDIRQGSHELTLAAPTFGGTAWSAMGQGVNVARAHQLPGEVLVTYSRSQLFELTGSFQWNAGVDYWLVHGSVRSSCPPTGSSRVSTG